MRIISFNSYKGGACRTTTCFNTLPFIAKNLGATAHQPILVFDADLDSMGLTTILAKNVFNNAPFSSQNLFVDDGDVISEISNFGLESVETDSFFKKFKKVGNELGLEDDGSVLFCGADMKASTISDDKFKTMKKDMPLFDIINALNDMAEEDRPKAIIFDCAAGVQPSTLFILSVAQYFVMCMRPTLQFRIGTLDYLETKIPDQIKMAKNNYRKQIILCPTSVASVDKAANGEESDELRLLRASAYKKIEVMKQKIMLYDFSELGYDLNTKMIESVDDMGIPEIDRFKWEECLLYSVPNKTEREEELIKKYEKLAGIICE